MIFIWLVFISSYVFGCGQEPVSKPPFTATYGDINNQEYSADGANCPLEAKGQETANLKFECPYAIVKVAACSEEEEEMISVKVGESTLDCRNNVVLKDSTGFYVAIAPGTYEKLTVRFAAVGRIVAVKSRKEAITLAANDLLRLPVFQFAATDWKKTLPEGALPGVFSVSDTKKVYFSQGNLRFLPIDGIWRFADNQYDILSRDGQTSDYAEYSRSWIDLFGWGTSGYNHGASCFQPWSTETNTADYYAYGNSYRNLSDGDGRADWGYNKIINGGDLENLGWRTLSSEEWQYLLGEKSGRKSNLREGRCRIVRFKDATATPLFFGLVIAPDDFVGEISESYTIDEWEDAESSSNLVLLPAAGRRHSATTLEGVKNYGYYWSGTAASGSIDAKVVYFTSSGRSIYPKQDFERSNGHSVRLVLDVK